MGKRGGKRRRSKTRDNCDGETARKSSSDIVGSENESSLAPLALHVTPLSNQESQDGLRKEKCQRLDHPINEKRRKCADNPVEELIRSGQPFAYVNDTKRINVSLILNAEMDDMASNNLPLAWSINDKSDDRGMQSACFSLCRSYLSQNEKQLPNPRINPKVGHRTKPKVDPADDCWNPTLVQGYLWSILMQTTWNTIAIAPTGSGKTLSYAIPTLLVDRNNDNLGKTNDDARDILILVPTRELVHQVATVFRSLIDLLRSQQRSQRDVDTTNRTVVAIHGGVSREDQVQSIRNARLHNRPLVVVATPGRLLDHLQQQKSDGDDGKPHLFPATDGMGFRWVVLDEADQLTKKGDLGPQVHDILTLLGAVSVSDADASDSGWKHKEGSFPRPRLTFVSATLPEKSHSKFEEWVGRNYVLVQVDQLNSQLNQKETKSQAQQSSTSTTPSTTKASQLEQHKSTTDEDTAGTTDANAMPLKEPTHRSLLSRIPPHLTQIIHVCAEHKKPRKLVHTLQGIQSSTEESEGMQSPVPSLRRGIVFYSKIEKLEYSLKLLQREGIRCLPLHGHLPMAKRQLHLQNFESGIGASVGDNGRHSLLLLLATDLAARGIDIPNLDFVIQYDFPGNLEQYVHRCGRAGRSNASANYHGKERGSWDNGKNNARYVVYSFFTRNLQPLAADLVQLLEASDAWVDPNLKGLVETSSRRKARNGEKGSKIDKGGAMMLSAATKKTQSIDSTSMKHRQRPPIEDEVADGDDDDNEFMHLSPNRVVLKRASHVSDASSSEDEV